jgi:hypothetical protein
VTETCTAQEQLRPSHWKAELVNQVYQFFQVWESTTPLTEIALSRPITNRRIHLAIFNEPYLTLVLERKKTLESRFSVKKIAPFHEVGVGDILVLKLSGGPIMGLATVASAAYIYISQPRDLEEIAARYSSALCIDNSDFWEQRKNATYCTLLELRNIERFEIGGIPKRDRLGWVVLQGEQRGLFLENA